jgi:hypothetical protein
VFVLRLPSSPEAQTPGPSEEDCPSASEIRQFTETGETTTEYFDIPTGQAYTACEFPGGASGIIYRLDIVFERNLPRPRREGGEPVASVGMVGIIEDPPEAGPNQGQTKLEDVPGRYHMELPPSDSAQEYVVTATNATPPVASRPFRASVPLQAVRPLQPLVHHLVQKPRHLLLPRRHHRPLRLPRLLRRLLRLLQTIRAR